MSAITDKVWPTTENMCMLHAIYYGLSVEEKALFTCDGKFDPREILLGVVDKKGRTLTHGATTEDAHRMFSRVVQNNKEIGKTVKFTWRRRGMNQKSGTGWKVKDLWKTVLSRPGKYVSFGKAKRANDKHGKLMAKMGAFKTDEGVLDEWGKIANGTHPMDHAVGIIVSDNLKLLIMDVVMVESKTFL